MQKITYPVILAAKLGDPDAMQDILCHYEKYINHHSCRSLYDSYGNSRTFVDEEIKSRIQAKLMHQIIAHFDPKKPPRGG